MLEVKAGAQYAMEGPKILNIFCSAAFHVKELWRNLGILEIVEQAMEGQRSGSVVLENLLLMDRPLVLKPSLDIKQATAMGG